MGCFVMLTSSLIACKSPFEPPPPPPPPPPALSVEVTPPIPSESCSVAISAYANGGGSGAYAVWGELKASTYDSSAQDYIPMPHPIELGRDVFGADQIKRGQAQSGVIDLEYFRITPGQEVLVRLELHFTVVDDSGAEAVGDPIFLELECG